MLFFINFALGACPSKYVIAGPRKSSICRLATLERAEARKLEPFFGMPPLAGAPAWSVPEQVYWSKVPKRILSADAPLCSALGRV